MNPRGISLGIAATIVVSLLAPIPAPAYPSYADQQDGSGPSRFRLHGYGEVHYNNPRTGTMDQSATSEADYHRFVLGWTYEFTPDLRIDAEVDYEHAARELELEYAHLDYDLGATTTLRVGSILMPVGPLNEFHEPPTFYSVERPYVQNAVIPTTWQENGLGIVGRASGGSLGYRAFVVAGLDASEFSALSGLRGGRSGGAESKAEDLAIVGRVEYATTAGISFGASGYYGGADQMTVDSVDVKVGLGTADVRYKRHGFDVRALVARVAIDGADQASALASASAGDSVGVAKAMTGWYGEVAYDLLRRDRKPESRRSLWVYGRYERFNTQEKMPAGYAADPAADRTVVSGGVAFLPIESVAFKADVEHWKDETTGPNSQLNRVNVGAAFMF